MCGFAGEVHGGAPVDKARLMRSVHSIVHRGPDTQLCVMHGDAGFGFARLAIVDLDLRAGQPMRSSHGKFILVFNGEVYNFRALRTELQARGHTFRTTGDTEVVLAGYTEWGDRLWAKLEGMYAIALYDTESRALRLVRDRFGKKPLFYSQDGTRTVFASEPKALRALGVALRFDRASLPWLYTLGYMPHAASVNEGVLQVAPNQGLLFEPGAAPRVFYTGVDVVESTLRVPTAEILQGVRDRVTAAVEKRLVADVPVGAFLSGGIDSSIVCAIAAKRLGSGLRTFSIGFSGDARYDETAHAERMAKHIGATHTTFTMQPVSWDLVDSLVDSHDGPFGDSSALPTSVVSKLTREHVTVALSGDGGDEVFAGYTRFAVARYAESLPAGLREWAAIAGRRIPARASERDPLSRAGRLARSLGGTLSERLLAMYPYAGAELGSVLKEPVDSAAMVAWSTELEGQGSALHRVLRHNLLSYLPGDLLVKADRSSMRHSLEVRSPFLDSALADYAFAIPDNLKLRGLTTKWVLRKAFEDVMPKSILTRGKMGFGVPLSTWFRGHMRAGLEERVLGTPALWDYVRKPTIERWMSEHMAGEKDHAQKLWLTATLAIWLSRV